MKNCSIPPSPPHQHLGLLLTFLIIVMVALAYASVPLYRLFCQKTGFGGTPQVGKGLSTTIVQNRKITVQFVANTHRDLPWRFKPLQHKVEIKVGENALAFYEAINLSDKPITGMATYNVSPDKAGIYFNKIACFCYEEQTLLPGQRMDMPVQFFIDPDFAEDPALQDVRTITLSYTFFHYIR